MLRNKNLRIKKKNKSMEEFKKSLCKIRKKYLLKSLLLALLIISDIYLHDKLYSNTLWITKKI